MSLDVLLEREPDVTASVAVWAAIETGGLKGVIATRALTPEAAASLLANR